MTCKECGKRKARFLTPYFKDVCKKCYKKYKKRIRAKIIEEMKGEGNSIIIKPKKCCANCFYYYVFPSDNIGECDLHDYKILAKDGRKVYCNYFEEWWGSVE